MTKIEEELISLRKTLLEMAASVEEMISKSVRSLVERNMIMAEEVKRSDPKVNALEIEIDNHCTRIIALYHPEAEDLRSVLMTLKMNNDLERIGDHAVNIAEQTIRLSDKPAVKPFIDIPRMGEVAIEMLKESIDSFVRKDSELALQVCKKDDIVDDLYNQLIRELVTYMVSDPSTIERAFSLIMVGKGLERVADLATNIAEDTYFLAEGKVIKHHAMDMVPEDK